jgi:hypothetical protein
MPFHYVRPVPHPPFRRPSLEVVNRDGGGRSPSRIEPLPPPIVRLGTATATLEGLEVGERYGFNLFHPSVSRNVT